MFVWHERSKCRSWAQAIVGYKADVTIAASDWALHAGEAGRGAQPKHLRALALRHSERSMIILLRSSVVASRIHHIASKSMQFDLTAPLLGRFDELRSLDEGLLPSCTCPTLA
jgi:hypothetical protein